MDNELKRAAKQFISWFEDNFAEEEFMDENEDWYSYSELDEYKELKEAISKE